MSAGEDTFVRLWKLSADLSKVWNKTIFEHVIKSIFVFELAINLIKYNYFDSGGTRRKR